MAHTRDRHQGGAGGLGRALGADAGAALDCVADWPVRHDPALVQLLVHGFQQHLCLLEQMQRLHHGWQTCNQQFTHDS